jgi:inner membrane protein involved in colicin E2 resistance
VVILTAYLSRMLDNRLAGYALTIALSTFFALIIKLISVKDMFLLLKKET